MDGLDLLETMQQVDLRGVVHDALVMNQSVMADLNANQLALGLRATGTRIRPDYHPLTIELKRGRGGLSGVTDRVTLHDTGAYYRSLYAEVKGDYIEYGARDSKEEKLSKKYGDTIHGLTVDSRDDLVEGTLRGDTIEVLREETGL